MAHARCVWKGPTRIIPETMPVCYVHPEVTMTPLDRLTVAHAQMVSTHRKLGRLNVLTVQGQLMMTTPTVVRAHTCFLNTLFHMATEKISNLPITTF